jgi:hypothetical protein
MSQLTIATTSVVGLLNAGDGGVTRAKSTNICAAKTVNSSADKTNSGTAKIRVPQGTPAHQEPVSSEEAVDPGRPAGSSARSCPETEGRRVS